jgi:sugar phosphate isomerase/epimerase
MTSKTQFNRRDFLKYSSLLTAGTLVLPSFIFKKNASVGVQLYTIRDLMQSDPKGTLKKVADLGYKKVEAAGYNEGLFYGMKPAEFKKVLSDLGLKMPSSHYSSGLANPEKVGTLNNGWEKVVEDAKNADLEYMVLAYLTEDERKTIGDYKKVAALLNQAGEICKQNGIKLAYHNHDFELKTLDNELPYDILLKEVDPSLLVMELDLYWTVKAGLDPVQLFKDHPGRFPLWHVKDMNEAGEFTEVGTGVIDFTRIFDNKKAAGLKHFFVEQDRTVKPPLESIEISYKNVINLI